MPVKPTPPAERNSQPPLSQYAKAFGRRRHRCDSTAPRATRLMIVWINHHCQCLTTENLNLLYARAAARRTLHISRVMNPGSTNTNPGVDGTESSSESQTHHRSLHACPCPREAPQSFYTAPASRSGTAIQSRSRIARIRVHNLSHAVSCEIRECPNQRRIPKL